MNNDKDPDVRLRASGGVSDRVFSALIVVAIIYLMVVLGGCGYLYHVTTSSDGTNITGDFMIGEPHENTTNLEVHKGIQGTERFDVPPRIEIIESNRVSED